MLTVVSAMSDRCEWLLAAISGGSLAAAVWVKPATEWSDKNYVWIRIWQIYF
jgi:hypothetical protein